MLALSVVHRAAEASYAALCSVLNLYILDSSLLTGRQQHKRIYLNDDTVAIKHTLTSLSMPPEMTCSAVSEKQTDVT